MIIHNERWKPQTVQICTCIYQSNCITIASVFLFILYFIAIIYVVFMVKTGTCLKMLEPLLNVGRPYSLFKLVLNNKTLKSLDYPFFFLI